MGQEAARGGEGGRSRKPVSGSQMSRRQLARTVADGRKLTFVFTGGERAEGYLCGMDDFHWMIVTPEGDQELIHKGSASRIQLGEERGYDAEERRDVLEQIIAPFRAALAREGLIPRHLVDLNASERIS